MNKMKRQFSLRDILSLLMQLKTREDEYPAALLAARRADFLAKMADMHPPDNKGPNNNTKTESNASQSSSANGGGSTVLKSVSGVQPAAQTLNTVLYALVGVISTVVLAEAIYLYREEIRNFFLPDNGSVVSSETLPAPLPTSATPLPEITVSASPTPTLLTPLSLTKQNGISTPVPEQTPIPQVPSPTKPGNRYGQVTKTP